MMTVPGFPIHDAFDAAWQKVRDARSGILLPAKCTACPKKEICEFCPAACYAENGDFTVAPAYLCRKLDAYLTAGKLWLAEYDAAHDVPPAT